jgi:quercetin dioxygenase-like cupin family protein
MGTSFSNPPRELADNEPVAAEHAGGTPAGIAPGYRLGPGEGPAVWFQGGLVTMKARTHDTSGQLGLVELHGPLGSVAPGHVHDKEGEGFWLLEGRLDISVGDTVFQMTPGTFVWVPPRTVHEWRITSAVARFIVMVVPGGFEHFFEELGEPALAPTFPYTEHRNPQLEEISEIGPRYGWSTGEGVMGTPSSAPRPVGRLVQE